MGRKNGIKKGVLLVWMAFLSLIMIGSIPMQAEAKKNAVEPGVACQKGRYLYYAFEMGGLRMGIMRYDTKTGKKKTLCKYQSGKEKTNGFYYLNATNKYIVAEWDKAYGTDHTNTYIYRFKRSNGKSAKKLAVGRNPVVIGKYIYYVECKQYGHSSWKYTMDTGYICRMKIDGKGKKRICKSKGYVRSLFNLNGKMGYVTDDCMTDTDAIDFFFDKNRKKIDTDGFDFNMDGYCSNSDGHYVIVGGQLWLYDKDFINHKVLFDSNNRHIGTIRVCGNYVFLRVENLINYTGKIYIMKKNGTKLKTLKTWGLAE